MWERKKDEECGMRVVSTGKLIGVDTTRLSEDSECCQEQHPIVSTCTVLKMGKIRMLRHIRDAETSQQLIW